MKRDQRILIDVEEIFALQRVVFEPEFEDDRYTILEVSIGKKSE